MANVTVYSSEMCPWCHKAKDFLKEHNIEFENKDVANDEVARNELMEKSGQLGVPVIIVEGHDPIIGFDIEAIKKALNI